MRDKIRNTQSPILRAWKWWFTPRSTDPTVTYRERALRVLLPIFLLLRTLATFRKYFVNSNLPEPYVPTWLSVLFYAIPMLLSFYFLLRQKVDWAGVFFVLHWFLIDLLSLPTEGYWHAGFQISLIIQIILAALLLPSRGMLPFLVIQLVTFGMWGYWLDINYYAPPLLSSGQPVAVFWRTLVTLGAQETIILLIVRYLRLGMEKSLRSQQHSIERLESEINERQRTEARLRSLVENTTDFILEIDRSGNILFINKHPEQYIGRTIRDVLSLDQYQPATEAIEKVFQTSEPQAIELKAITPDGSINWDSVRLGPIKTGDEVTSLTVIMTGITKQKLAEQERENLIAELETKNTELTQFVYTVSHDLKSPLITISGFLGFLKEDARAGNIERLEQDIQRITDATIKMKRLLDELLELSRIGRFTNPLESVPFDEVVQESLELVKGQLNDGKIEVKVGDAFPLVQCDRIRLVQVMQNLIDNAAKFMGEQETPVIEIGFYKNKDQNIFFVRDNGIGIEPEYHDKIFNLFDKLDPRSDGTGIGLSLVKRIINVHGGEIWVESKGKRTGTTFMFTLSNDTVKNAGG